MARGEDSTAPSCRGSSIALHLYVNTSHVNILIYFNDIDLNSSTAVLRLQCMGNNIGKYFLAE